jgi:hypothetical protein
MKAKLVFESINFERGKDPKSAMDIGKSYLDKEKIKSIKWEAEIDSDLIFEDPYEFIESYNGYPILMFMDSLEPEEWYGMSSTYTGIYLGPYRSKNKAIEEVKNSIDSFVELRKFKEDNL